MADRKPLSSDLLWLLAMGREEFPDSAWEAQTEPRPHVTNGVYQVETVRKMSLRGVHVRVTVIGSNDSCIGLSIQDALDHMAYMKRVFS